MIIENICPERSIANGTLCHLHSLGLQKKRREDLQKVLSIATPGQVIYLDEPPESINVKLTIDPLSWPANGSLVNDEVVIPVTLGKYHDTATYTFKGNTKTKHRIGVTVKEIPVRLIFACTMHKVQGQTLKRVIVHISKRPNKRQNIKFEMLYVALTRVRKGADLRIVSDNLNHLRQLTPNKLLKRFFALFDQLGNWNSPSPVSKK